MISNTKRWTNLFLFCAGLALAAGFCMKWIEPGFRIDGKLFTILELEFHPDIAHVDGLFRAMDPYVRSQLHQHLVYDYAFMAGVYPGIAALCMLAANRFDGRGWKRLLVMLAVLQLFAWGFDMAENYFLLKWLKAGKVGIEFRFFHLIVYSKWVLALSGFFAAILIIIFRRRKHLVS
jgi:hypothetical protein